MVAPRRVRWTALAWTALAFVLLVASLPFRLDAPHVELDPSWHLVLTHAIDSDWQFGTDLVFTYGPLGGLMCGLSFHPSTFWVQFCWGIGAASSFAWTVFALLRPASRDVRILTVVYFIVGASWFPDAWIMLWCTMASVLLARDVGRHTSTIAAVILLAVLAATKFTLVPLALSGLAAAAVIDLRNRRRRRLLLVVVGFVAAFVAMWLAAGQGVGNLPAYFAHSIQMAHGYTEGMGIEERRIVLHLGLLGIGITAALLASSFAAGGRTFSAKVVVALLIVHSFSYWKVSVVRADGHARILFLWLLCLGVSISVLLPAGRRLLVARTVLQLAAIVVGVTGIYVVEPSQVVDALENTAARIHRGLEWIGRPSSVRADLFAKTAAAASQIDMPATRERIHGDSVGLLGSSQGIVFLNNFNYRPQPVFQSYAVLTRELEILNADFFASAGAPSWVLQETCPIDQRPPPSDDALALRALPFRYEYVLSERKFNLWKRRPVPSSPGAPRLVREGTARLGETIELSDLSAHSVWLEVDWGWTLAGSLRAFVYKPPEAALIVHLANGGTSRYRLPRPIASAGFLLSPLVADNAAFVQYATQGTGERVRSIVLDASNPGLRELFAAPVRYRLSTVDEPPRK